MKKYVFLLSFLCIVCVGMSVCFGSIHEKKKTEMKFCSVESNDVENVIAYTNPGFENYSSEKLFSTEIIFKTKDVEKSPHLVKGNLIMQRCQLSKLTKNFKWSNRYRLNLLALRRGYTCLHSNTFNYSYRFRNSRLC